MTEQLYLAANLVAQTGIFGHLQIVYEDQDGFLYENETTSPGFPYFFGNWAYPEFGRPHDTESNTPGYGNPDKYSIVPLGLRPEQTAEHVWELMGQIHASLLAGDHGLDYDVEQNSNSYAGSILSVVGIDITDYLGTVTPPDVLGFPGVNTNIFQGAKTGGLFSDYDTPIALNLAGTSGNDYIASGIGNDTLGGAAGNDTIYAGDGSDFVHGGPGNDQIWGGSENDTLHGGTQEDTLHGNAGDDHLYGDAGFDMLNGGEGSDTLEGGNNADNLFGDSGDDLLLGGNGSDRLFGSSGSDELSGGEGNDLLLGGTQEDTLHGGIGDDRLYGDAGFDSLNGGDGNDTLDGGAQADNLHGEDGNDLLIGGHGLDRLFGGMGNDVLRGGGGNDALRGGAGFDTIHGGEGNDLLQGNFNADTFVMADGFGQDMIVDFDAFNSYEKIDLSEVTSILNYSDLYENHMSQSGADVLIEAGDDQLTLRGVEMAALGSDDFIF